MVGILDSYTVAQYGNLHIRHFDKEGDDENCAGGGMAMRTVTLVFLEKRQSTFILHFI